MEKKKPSQRSISFISELRHVGRIPMPSRPQILSVSWASTIRESNLYERSQKILPNENSLMNGLTYRRQASLLHRPVAHDLYRTPTVD